MNDRDVIFALNGMLFEYDKEKNDYNIEKHGISFEIAARVFADYNRIEFYDEDNSISEDRFDTIGDVSLCIPNGSEYNKMEDCPVDGYLLFVVYTERYTVNGSEITRLISARPVTRFEKELYYGKKL